MLVIVEITHFNIYYTQKIAQSNSTFQKVYQSRIKSNCRLEVFPANQIDNLADRYKQRLFY